MSETVSDEAAAKLMRCEQTDAGGAPAGNVASRFVANLGMGCRLLFFFPACRGRLHADATQLLLLLLFSQLLQVALQFAPLAWDSPEFNRWALDGAAALLGLQLVGVYLLALLARRLDALMRLLVALAALGPPSVVLAQALQWLGNTDVLGAVGLSVAGGGVTLLALIAIVRALRLVLGASVIRAAILTSFYLATSWGALWLFPQSELWYVPGEDSEAPRVDVEEDVLFLFLTSHGSEDHRLSVRFWPLGLNDINPAQLRGLLDESGIRNRVVVVSACYSGGFIDALRDERTLVITAAAPDRQSFGCGHHNDFTWFGKAYFDEALREQFDFVAAFTAAAQRLAEREKAEAETPSLPQMAEGAAIGPVLKALETRLRERAAPVRAEAPAGM